MSSQRASSTQRTTATGPSSIIHHQWEDESVDAYESLQPQMCQPQELWFFSETTRFRHGIQKGQESHRLLWNADVTLTGARQISQVLQKANLGLREQKQLFQVTSVGEGGKTSPRS